MAGLTQVSVGVSAVGITTDASKISSGILIKPHPSNTGVVYVRCDGTTATTSNGYPLAAGDDPLFVPLALCADPTKVSLIASVASQAVGVLYL